MARVTMTDVLGVRRLLVLRAVARHGSLAAAARELRYTQPAVSHHIRRLEAEADDHLFMILPTSHPLAGEEEVELSRLATEPWIISERCRAQTLHACALAGFTPTIALATDDYQHTVPRLVAAGLGVSPTTACVSREVHRPDVALVPVAGIAPRRIIAALPANPRPTAAVSALLEALQKAASRAGGTGRQTR